MSCKQTTKKRSLVSTQFYECDDEHNFEHQQNKIISILGTHSRFNTYVPRKLYTNFGTFVTIQLKFCINPQD